MMKRSQLHPDTSTGFDSAVSAKLRENASPKPSLDDDPPLARRTEEADVEDGCIRVTRTQQEFTRPENQHTAE